MSNVQVAPPGEARVRTTVREMMKVGTRMAPFTSELRKRKDLLEGPT